MTKAELVEAVALQTRLTKKDAAHLMDVVFDNIGKAVKANELMKLKATKTIGFRPAKELKDTL